MQATAVAHPNIALVKYWGKLPGEGNVPAVGSLSVTLAGMRTRTTVTFDATLGMDAFQLNGRAASPEQTRRVSDFLDRVRHRSATNRHAQVVSDNDFPTGAGLASSASGFAALALAATGAAGLHLTPQELAALACQGSGSAARSIFGGYVVMQPGATPAGDGGTEQLATPEHWPLKVLVAITSEAAKPVGSTRGMRQTQETSPYFAAWVDAASADLAAARHAVAQRNFADLAIVGERSCLKLHGLVMSADPGLLYWSGTTVDLMHRVRAWRARGVPVFFTIDAGPQVKVLCPPDVADQVRDWLVAVPGVQRVLTCALGPGAHLVPA